MDVKITLSAGLEQSFQHISELLSRHVSDPPTISQEQPLTLFLDANSFINILSRGNSQSDTNIVAQKRKLSNDSGNTAKKAKWDEANCPILLNEKAVLNMTDMEIPKEVWLVASLGRKFVPPIDLDKPRILLDIHKIPQEDVPENQRLFRESNKILKSYEAPPLTRLQKNIADIFSTSAKFLKEHPDIKIKGSDKGNVSVIFNIKDYNVKMRELLEDKTVYEKVNVSSHLGYIKRNYNLLKRFSEFGLISEQNILNIVSKETQNPRIYGLYKIHKNFKIRPIMSCVNTPGSRLFELILKPINRMDRDNRYSIRNTSQLINDIKAIKLKEDDILVSFDVVSMFTNIPPETALNILLRGGIHNHTTMNLELFIQSFRFLTQHATEFLFENTFYKQISGLPMGAKGSPSIASIVLTYILDSALAKHPQVTFIKKYIDDIICITSLENAQAILRTLNSIIPSVQFTLEVEAGGCLNFLDVSLKRRGDLSISTRWFCKHYASNRLVNYYSEHEGHTVRNTAVQYISNMLKYSDEEFHSEILNFAKLILQRNSFPDDVIQEHIDEALNLSGEVRPVVEDLDEIDDTTKNYISVLAPNKLLAIMNRCARSNSSNVKFVNTYMNANADSHVFAHLKQKLDTEYQNNIIVQLFCKGCRYNNIAAITRPLILYKAISLNTALHPYNGMKNHQKSANHVGYRVSILKHCKSIPDTLRHTELLCRQKNLPIPMMARNKIDKRSLRLLD